MGFDTIEIDLVLVLYSMTRNTDIPKMINLSPITQGQFQSL